MADIHQEHKNKQETQEYMELVKERYKIEAKNVELKISMDMLMLLMQVFTV